MEAGSYSPRQQENDMEHGSETIKTAIPITGPGSENVGRGCIRFQRSGTLCPV